LNTVRVVLYRTSPFYTSQPINPVGSKVSELEVAAQLAAILGLRAEG
jgi:hypothetical protein